MGLTPRFPWGPPDCERPELASWRRGVLGREEHTSTTSGAGPPLRGYRQMRHRSTMLLVGGVSLAFSVRCWARLPDVVYASLLAPVAASVRDPLLTLGLPWPVWLRLGALAFVGLAVGTALVGAGLLLRARGAIAVGLVAVAPATIMDLLLVPGRTAMLMGRADPQTLPAGVALGNLREALALRGGAGVAASALIALYFWWVWRAYRRMHTDATDLGQAPCAAESNREPTELPAP